jgi:predicted nucleic acid-binding protein
MILVDTSVWVDHLRQGIPVLSDLLTAGKVAAHPFVVGELACGNPANRAEILRLLSALPTAKVATHAEVLHLVETRRLHGRGVGWIDMHLLASALLSRTSLWTRDRNLHSIARTLGIAEKT